MNVETRNTILTVVLAIIIVVLGWILYHSIVDPYQVVIQRQNMTERVHDHMEGIRDGMVRYNRRHKHFPPNDGGLDSLVQFIRTDSIMIANKDSLFQDDPKVGYTYMLDSLIYSPRPPHKQFEYTLNDTIRPPVYRLKDPDSDDQIGSLSKTTKLNAPNWK